MSRRARIDVANNYYHIIARGQRKNPLFFSPKDKEYFILLLLSILQEFDILLIAYCLMTNHFHLLIYRRMDSLGIIMKKLDTQYALYFNKKYDLVGHVFQGRYKSFIVLDEKYLLYLVKYIHNNPVKAQIVKDATEYKFSSAGFYEGTKSILPIEKLPLFKGKKGIIRYKNFMKEEDINIFYYKDSIGSKEDYLKFKKRKTGRELSNFHLRRSLDKNNIIVDSQKVCDKYNIKFEEFTNTKWAKNTKEIKKKIILELTKKGYTRAEISRLLNVHRSMITKRLK